jgi:hypothetical protein
MMINRYANILLWLCAPMLVFLPGCLDEDVRTIVSADGSSERIYSLQNSTRELPANAFPRPLDDSWTIEWKKPKATDSAYVYTARKKFATPEALSSEYSGARDTGIVGISVSLKKRFEWFYSYLDYRESYVMRNKLVSVPISEFMTKDEIERYIRGESSDSLKEKVERWDIRNLYEAFYAELITETQRRNDRELTPVLLNQKKEELYGGILAADSIDNANKKTNGDSTKKVLDNEYILKLSAKIFGTNAVLKYDSFIDTTLGELFKKQSPGGHPDNWTSSVQMPGILLATNSTTVEGNSASWKFASGQIHIGEYVMTASSRVTNVWAFVVAGIIALLVVALGIVGAARKKGKRVAF